MTTSDKTGLKSVKDLEFQLQMIDIFFRPVMNESEPLILTFGITLQQIIDVVREGILSLICKFSPRPVKVYNIMLKTPKSKLCAVMDP